MDTTLDLDKLIEETAARLKLQKSAIEDSPNASSEGSGPPADADPDVKEDKEEQDAKEGKDSGEGSEGSAPPADAPAPTEDPAADALQAEAPPTLEQLVSEYAALPDHLLDLCLQAAQQAKAMKVAPVAPPVAAPAPPIAPAAPPVAPPAAAPSADPMLALKSENLKYMQELSAALAKNEELIKLNERNTKIVEEFIKDFDKPTMRKSFVASSEVNPPKDSAPDLTKLSKAEINGMLRAKLRDGKLTKSEADLVSGFAMGSKTIKDIAHLLK